MTKCSGDKESRTSVTQIHTLAEKTNSHGHAKLLQPLLLQLFGLEEEFKAALALVVSEVEAVGPLQQGRKNMHVSDRE